jgi:putative aldouronate transport system substrate-binding protein
MKHKIVSLVLLVVMLGALFGCSTPATPTAQPTAAPTAAAAQPTAAPTLGPVVTLDFYFEGNGDSTDRQAVEDAINAYITPLINAKVVFHCIGWGDWATKAVTALQAGQKIDLFFTADWNGYMDQVDQGLLTPLNDDKGPNGNLLQLYGQGILKSLNPEFITGSQVDGVNYAVPTNKELSVPWGFVYNVAVADKIGMTDAAAAAIKTPADMEPWLAKAKAAYPDMYPYLTDGTVGFLPWIHAFATNISDYIANQANSPDANGKYDETVIVPFATDWMKSYLTTMRDWYNKGYINKDAGLTTFQTSTDLNAGNFLFEPMPLKGNNIKAQELVIASGNADLKLKEIYESPKIVASSDAGGSMFAIPKSSDNPVAAMKLLNLLHTDSKLVNMMLYGVPDTGWTLDADGRVNIAATNDWIKQNPGGWVWGDVTLQTVSNKEDPQKNKLLIDYSKDAINIPQTGFRFRTKPVAPEMTAIQTVVDGSQRALLTGYVDPATELPKFLQGLKDAGLDKVIAEVQTQYDAWKAAKAK